MTIIIIIINIRHESDLIRPVSASSNGPSRVSQVVFVHLVYISVLFSSSCAVHSPYMSQPI